MVTRGEDAPTVHGGCQLKPGDHAPALYFENDPAFRRVTDYPADWRDLPTGELEILSRGT